MRGQVAASKAAGERAVVQARAAGDGSLIADILSNLVAVTMYGPTPVGECVRLAEDILAGAGSRRGVEARARRALAALRAMQGRFDEARELARQSIAIVEDLGNLQWLAGAHQVLGLVEALAGDAEAAERAYRCCYELFERHGVRSYLATQAAVLARVLVTLGLDDEAEELTRVSEADTAEDDIDSQMHWRATRALVWARRGDHAEARRLAGEALALARRTDLYFAADVVADVGDVAALAGRVEEAAARYDDAQAAYERKGDVVSAARARHRRAVLRAPQVQPAR
jgi:tetratricopeptide (TPR) repeat protein